MNKEDLKQYRYIAVECEAIKISNQSYENLKVSMNRCETDNHNQNCLNEAINAVIMKNRKKINELHEKQKSVISWLNSIDDPIMKQSIELRFIQGYSWQRVTDTVTHGYIQKRTLCKQVLQFIDKQCG